MLISSLSALLLLSKHVTISPHAVFSLIFRLFKMSPPCIIAFVMADHVASQGFVLIRGIDCLTFPYESDYASDDPAGPYLPGTLSLSPNWLPSVTAASKDVEVARKERRLCTNVVCTTPP